MDWYPIKTNPIKSGYQDPLNHHQSLYTFIPLQESLQINTVHLCAAIASCGVGARFRSRGGLEMQKLEFHQGSLNYIFWGDQTMQMYGNFEGFPV